MTTGEEKFAQTQPLTEPNDADALSKETGLTTNDVESLGRSGRN